MPSSLRVFVVLMTAILLQGCIVKVNADTYGRDIDRVFGSIDIDDGQQVGNVDSVNGSIETVNGNVVLEPSTVEGDIVFEDNDGGGWGWFRNKDKPRLTINDRSEVQGTIILYRPVELRIDDGAIIGDIERHYDAR